MLVINTVGKKGPESWLVTRTDRDFHTHYGALPAAALKPGVLDLHGQRFSILPAGFADRYRGMKRKAQIITPKDAGFIIAHCGLGKDSVAVEAGSGSGSATALLARVCREVHSYERNPAHLEVARENVERLGLANVTFHEADFCEQAGRHDADLVLLDMPEPWHALSAAGSTAKQGAFVVAYTPTIVQASRFVEELPEGWVHERTLELIDRDWKVRGRAIRPGNAPMGHTAFLTVVRVLG